MATTKVRGELVDLNESTSESGLKMPTGDNNNRPTAATGMIRNNTNESSDSSASCEEYYNGSAWKQLNNVAIPDYFNTLTWTGDSSGTYPVTSSKDITGLGFQPDYVVVKRTDGTGSYTVYDSNRGDFEYMYWNSGSGTGNTGSGTYPGGIGALSDGIKVWDDAAGNYGVNGPGNSYIAYCWQVNGGTTVSNGEGNVTSTVQVNTDAGFSIVSFTTPASPSGSTTVGHGLGATPDMILLKRTDGTEDWYMYQTGMGLNEFMSINTQNSQSTATNLFGVVNSTVFCPSFTLTGNQACIAYCFKETAELSKWGTYTGTGLAGQTITVGFEPTWILLKSTVGTDNWRLYDTTRGITAGGYLEPNNTDGNNTANAPAMTITSTGWEITSGGVAIGDNAAGNAYTYWAIK